MMMKGNIHFIPRENLVTAVELSLIFAADFVPFYRRIRIAKEAKEVGESRGDL